MVKTKQEEAVIKLLGDIEEAGDFIRREGYTFKQVMKWDTNGDTNASFEAGFINGIDFDDDEVDTRVSFVCKRAAELRIDKSESEMSQHDAFVIANKEWRKEHGEEKSR